MNAENIKRYFRHYFYVMFVKSWNGAWSAADAGLGLAAGAIVSVNIDFPTWQGLAAIFTTAFVRNAVTYLARNPLPEKLESQPPFDTNPARKATRSSGSSVGTIIGSAVCTIFGRRVE